MLVNAEADSLIEPCPPDLLPTVLEAERKLRVFVELSGRVTSRYPCNALETARRARAANWGVSINDIEFSAAGLALVPTLEPDVVKLNHSLISSGFAQSSAALIAAMGESERTGAALLLERVENSDAAMVAKAAGARYQQGHLLGRPGPLPASLPQPLAPLPLRREDVDTTAATPWSLLHDGGAPATTGISQAALDHLVLAAATRAGAGDQLSVVAVVAPPGDVEPARQAMFAMLLERCPLIVLLGHGVAGWSDWRVRAADLPVGHALADETCFVLLAPGVSMALAGRRHHRDGAAPVWDLAVSQRPEAGQAVMRRLLGTVGRLEGGVHSH
ncbi:EAL domain-containing protein [Dactylosporangium sp. McL0621]|uniref:EAL domain-containing protein n=1 Tax=Dactylosporangium sp. McL0621 TaxID=3415678 RepID=UPI003CE82000